MKLQIGSHVGRSDSWEKVSGYIVWLSCPDKPFTPQLCLVDYGEDSEERYCLEESSDLQRVWSSGESTGDKFDNMNSEVINIEEVSGGLEITVKLQYQDGFNPKEKK